MAITFFTDGKITRDEHIGCVIDRETRAYRAMSAVYTTAAYALVWVPEQQTVAWILVNINYMGCDEHGVITRDITKGIYAEDYEIWLLVQEDIKRENERIEAIRRAKKEEQGFKKALCEPVKGATCRAIKGRKVPKGTEGVIFYVRYDRIGFKDSEGTAWWINADQIEVNYANKGYDWQPADSWKDEYSRVSATWSLQQAYSNGQRNSLR